ncbi:MAG: SDR family oxidoreductase [Actinobacteria bacterium]|nr:SDR family oxidoreductase [Actinomycetota bacterium]
MRPTTENSPADQLFDVRDKNVVITGGSRGIGAMIARGFLNAGAHVLISARKEDQLRAAQEELSAFGSCQAVVADLSIDAGTTALADAVGSWTDRVHVLVNNAGATWGAPVEDYPKQGFEKVLDTNVKGVFYLTTKLLPLLRAAASDDDPARVINIGSIDGISAPIVENYAYSASKAAVHQLTKHLAKRLAGERVTVNAIAPGPFESKMMEFVLADPNARAQVEQSIPLGRIGRPDDVAGTAIFLSSRAGAYLSGTIIPVDGGRTGTA